MAKELEFNDSARDALQRGVDQLAQGGAHGRRRQENIDQHVVELDQEPHQGASPGRRRQTVRPVAAQPGGGLLLQP